jgi:hypothetical protein
MVPTPQSIGRAPAGGGVLREKGCGVRILRRAGREVTVDFVDDIDGTEAGETVKFELDGSKYEIDLSGPNASELRQALSPYVDRARADRGVF